MTINKDYAELMGKLDAKHNAVKGVTLNLNGESLCGAIIKAVRQWWKGKRRRGLDPQEYRI